MNTGVIFNKSGVFNANGEARVGVYMRVDGSRYVKTLPFYVHPGNWDNRKKRVKPSDDDHTSKNIIIESELGKFMEFMAKFYLERRSPTQDEVNAFIKGKQTRVESGSFSEYFYQNIGRSRVVSSLDLATVSSRKGTLHVLNQFKRNIRFEDVNSTLIEKFAGFRKKEGDSDNTVNKHLKNLKSMVILAKYDGKISDRLSDDPFKTTRIRIKPSGVKVALTFSEYDRVKALDYTPSDGALYSSWKMFLFSCRTSLRVSDVTDLRMSHINTTENGYTIIKDSVKASGGVYRINLSFIAETFNDSTPIEILEEYYDPEAPGREFLFPVRSRNIIAEKLRQIIADAEITKNVSFHTARHTCATHLAAKDVGLFKIKRIGGWKDTKTLNHYINMADEMLGRV